MDNLLAKYALSFSRRVLSLLDKNSFSPTYGCFDRNFWHYKTVTDYPSATYQQLALYLTYLYTYKTEHNTYYKQPELLGLILASIDYWVKIQNNDGSFNEWFPNEHSHVATAFTLYAITESLLILKEDIEDQKLKSYFASIKNACLWLKNNPDTKVLNHTAGALTATYNAYLLTLDAEISGYIDMHRSIMKKYQSAEGWFHEYHGADIGYTSVSIDYLAKYYEKSGDEIAYYMLEKAVSFLAFFIHPDGSSGGEYGNRNTKYIMPAGIHILAKYFDEARYILDKFYYGFKYGNQVELSTSDDRYFAFFFATNYIESAALFDTLTPENFTYNSLKYKYFSQIFPQAGLVVKKTPRFYFVCNFKKGGIIKLYSADGKLLYSDSGYFVKFKNNKIASSQKLTQNTDYYIDNSSEYEIELKFEAPFIWVNTSLPLTKLLIPFRIFNYTFGHFSKVMDLFNTKLKKFMITEPKLAPLKIKRTITIKDGKLKVNDVISKSTKLDVLDISLPSAKTNLHVPSSRYALSYDIREFTGIDPVCIKEINTVNLTCINTTVGINNGDINNESSRHNTAQ
jgi:hypothetical protein